jgi:hypothetical protein
MRTFATESDFTGAISASLDVLPPEVRTAVSAGIATGDAAARGAAPGDDGTLNLRLGGWVLRDQDVPVTELIGIVGAAVTAAMVPGAIAAGAVITALTSFAAVAWKAWRRGAKLSKPEIAVLGFLEVQGPMTLDELKARAPAALPDLSPTDVERAVATLQDIELRDGDIVALIRNDAAGLWRLRAG